jgi:D-glycero-D-manno-heptose 1,7-bisphosphate phosphatase
MTGRPAAFLDRDGTIIRDANYIRDPADVELLPGVATALRDLSERGVAVIVVTNQSGIARGLFTAGDYEAVRQRLDALLAAQGARIDATYVCPHYPDVTGPCECRKPGLALYRKAIRDHHLDPARSVYVGDRWRDVAPALVLGGLPILLDVDWTPEEDRVDALRNGVATEKSLVKAVERYIATLPAPTGEE